MLLHWLRRRNLRYRGFAAWHDEFWFQNKAWERASITRHSYAIPRVIILVSMILML